MMKDIYIGLGSNLADRQELLRRAARAIGLRFGAPVRLSRIYETQARIRLEQPPFLNAVAHLRANLEPDTLLAGLMAIEASMGRDRTRAAPNGPRRIDLDLLMVGDLCLQTPDLTLPHPGIAARRFVLVPLAELASDVEVPTLGATVGELLARCEDTGWVEPLNKLKLEKTCTSTA